MMKKILLSAAIIVGIGGAAFVATNAFFSDTETSTGNLFQAGTIDLKIDNTSYYGYTVDQAGGLHMLPSPSTTWTAADLTNQLFFNFNDVKPGDLGEDTISVDLTSNPAWVCVDLAITKNDDDTCNEPELADDPTCAEPNQILTDGELAGSLNFLFWKDDGDNVFETGEVVLSTGPASNVLGGVTWAIADSQTGDNLPMQPGVNYIGKAWCFGALTQNPVAQGASTGPDVRGPGVTCDGASVNNAAQSDILMGDVTFRAVQSRNNPGFVCAPETQRRSVGAALDTYSQPTGDTCNVNVTDGGVEPNTIAEGIAQAVNGNTVCVDAGTYDEDVVINKEITLAGDGATLTSVINGQVTGQGAAVTIAANNVTLKGFQINGAGIAALWLNTGVSGATVEFNKMTSASGVTAVTTQGSQSNHIFRNNEFVGTSAGQMVYVNGSASLGQPSSNVDFDNNTFSGTIVAGGVALGNESTLSDITDNKFASTLTSTYAIAETWEDDANINFNNFNGVGGIKVRNGDAGTVDAENNWWGAAVPAGHTFGLVDDNPMEASAFPEN